MDIRERRRIEARIGEINLELGIREPRQPSDMRASEHSLEEMEELYAEREQLLQELEKDC